MGKHEQGKHEQHNVSGHRSFFTFLPMQLPFTQAAQEHRAGQLPAAVPLIS